MQKMNTEIANLGMRVLSFLDVLLQTGSVTRTGEIIGISQPSASRMLARTRHLIGDPLLIRTQKGYQLTDHARSLREPVLEAISALQAVFTNPEFNPAESGRKFRIACTDYAVACVIGPLMRNLTKEAPSVSMDVLPLVPESFVMLDDGEIDFVLYATLNMKGDYIVQKLFDEGYALVMRKGHPLQDLLAERSALEPEDIAGFPHVEFSYPTQEFLQADPVLRGESGNAKSALSVPFFTAMPFIVAGTDAVAPVPGRFGAVLARDYNVNAVPYRPSHVFPYHLIWHERSRSNPAICWMVEQIVKTTK
ncbi:LysR family transcriptional regulator [Roseibium sp. SCPC15]|uniref:LysR family transcriptional regulator n=1 Tax=Roseibium sp. SCP15 TaxID=3141376 RepID=UPI00333C3865